MMTAPLNLTEIRRDQRRVAALLNASRQLDIVVPPYRGIPYENLYRSNYHTQLQHGRSSQASHTASAPTRLSEPQLYNRRDRHRKHDEEWESRPLRFSAPTVPFLSGGYPSFNQVHARHSEQGVGNLNFSYPIARDSDVFIGSWQNKDPVEKKIYSKRQQRPDNSFKGWPQLDNPRPKRKKPTSDEPKPRRQRKRSTHQIADFRLPKPKKSETVPIRSHVNRKPPQPSDYGGSSTRRRPCGNPTVPPVVKYHHDVVDLSLQTGAKTLDECITEPESKIVPSKATSTHVEEKVEKRNPNTDSFKRSYSVLSQFHRQSVSKPAGVVSDSSEDEPSRPSSEHVSNHSKDESDHDMEESESLKKSDEDEDNDSDEDMYDFDLDSSSLYRNFSERTLPSGTTGDPWGQAYVQALAKARERNMPFDLEEFNHRMTRPYTFSYFTNHRPSCKCVQCLRSAFTKNIKKRKGKKKSKAPSGMKTILGKVKIHDYFHFKPHVPNS
ncbi:uncharacterized protein [Amphiura filiformis]|uniref:uncharacterized protein n=1 Tax=Amphiura filiformis TaxID=82378 RepID=UPI003B2194F6